MCERECDDDGRRRRAQRGSFMLRRGRSYVIVLCMCRKKKGRLCITAAIAGGARTNKDATPHGGAQSAQCGSAGHLRYCGVILAGLFPRSAFRYTLAQSQKGASSAEGSGAIGCASVGEASQGPDVMHDRHFCGRSGDHQSLLPNAASQSGLTQHHTC